MIMMDEIIVSIATKSDKPQLLEFFKHYSNPEILENRIDCYLSHNSTILAKDGGKIVGTLQWHIKEDPNCGVVEFEEFHVLEDYRNKGTGSSLLEHGIQSVKDTFHANKIKHPKYVNVCVENINYTPISIDTVLAQEPYA